MRSRCGASRMGHPVRTSWSSSDECCVDTFVRTPSLPCLKCTTLWHDVSRRTMQKRGFSGAVIKFHARD